MKTQNKSILSLTLILLSISLSGCFNNKQTPNNQEDTAQDPQFINLLNSVVRIDIWENNFFKGRKSTERGVGSGVIVDDQGHILTNSHVANIYDEKIQITLSTLEQVPASLVGWDHWTDLAIIKLDLNVIKKKNIKLTHADFGDSSFLYPGKIVYAAGTPHGLTRTVTKGIISNTHRFFDKETLPRGHETGYFNTWLQTDAAINPGNSGGPLVTPDGKIIGINTRGKMLSNNLGFAVPGNVAKEVMRKLIKNKTITRSYIGITPVALNDFENSFSLEIKDGGLLIGNVDPSSPANNSELRPGDVITKINNDPVNGSFPEQLPAIQNKIANYPVGTTLSLEVVRGKETLEIEVTTETLESRIGEEYAFEDWGLGIRKLTSPVARDNQLKSSNGCIVIGLQQGFPIEKAGIKNHDVILRANNTNIATLDDFKAIYAIYQENPDSMLFEILRNHQVMYFVVKAD